MAVTSSTPKLKRSTTSLPKLKESELGENLKNYAAEEKTGKGMNIFAFISLLGFGLALDFVDLLDFTGFGAVITTIVSFVLGLGMFVFLYFADQGDYRFAREALGWIIEIIPGIGVLPINTSAVILAYFLSKPENQAKIKQVMEATEAGKAIAEAAGKLNKATKLTRAGK
ncbi:MAG: hypothetical protein UX26_C0028G0007 [Parcubacteria group bacterium GW2011_GWC1_45_9]|nr:MAG: hypothetical protein UX26_C0028G0007 [Parcubacteria group bacterium GW2011_GWC1_45_9]HCI05383.1 hypothetical protein [Patescibacteria group bacterium]